MISFNKVIICFIWAVATPKQIRDHMKVDGLTNDEVKSHLQVTTNLFSRLNFKILLAFYLVINIFILWNIQKYRLHTRRPAASMTPQGNGNSQQPQFVVVGGIWVPSPPQDVPPASDVANNGGGIYAPVTLRPPPSPQSPKRSVERSSGQCNSQAASSSTNTTTSSPVS